MATKLLSAALLLAGPALTSPLALPNSVPSDLNPHSSSPLSASFFLSRRANQPPQALPQSAPANDIRYQPVLDFDKDGCYNVPAIGPDGSIVAGLPHNFVSASSDCRDASDLDNNNVYSRSRCNSGWCVYLYDYYFEKDVAIPNFIDVGHTHDWEHIAVWVRTSTQKPEYVAVSQHGNYEIKKASDVRWEGEHPKIVYHKDGASTHCFRFANSADDQIENHKGVWFRGALVGYNGFPEGLRDRLFGWDFGKATIALKDSQFAGNLERARPGDIGSGGFDVGRDE
ncbi:necrosis inducing protein [Naviculisporaceae sp. PSN 640]